MDLWGGGSQNRIHTETRADRLHMELTLEPLNRQLNVDVGQNLLAVLRAHDIPISYSCMSGRCGTCRCRVTKGRVLNSGPETGRPKAQGDDHVLACQAVLTEDCTIELPEVDEVVVHPARIIKGTVVAVEQATHHESWLQTLKQNRWEASWLSGKDLSEFVELDLTTARVMVYLLKLKA